VKAASCLACTELLPAEVAVLAVAEAATGGHHHHAVTCLACGSEWYDDVVTGGFGIPIPSRRDTLLCGCPENGRLIYRPSVMLVPPPESACRCDSAELRERITTRP
jgi:hypothetical protein